MSRKSIEFHVKNNDYFGTVATVISLIRQNNELKNGKIDNKILFKLESDFMFLQNNYLITKKKAK